MAREIRWQDLPRAIRADAKGIKKSAANALNTVAFKALKELPVQAAQDMKFRGNPRAALGWRVEKANLNNLEATLSTSRGWFGLHADEGRRDSGKSRFVWQGTPYLIIPRKGSGLVDRRGKIRRNAWPQVYLAPKGGYALVLYRQRGKAKGSELIGIAVKQAEFHKDTNWDGVIEQEWIASFHREFERNVASRIAFKAGR
jgi:hypothetical protein